MLVSTKGRYALRMMIDIATNSTEKPLSLKDISQRQEMPLKYLEQLARLLTQNGLLSSVRGQRGGYLLAAPADEIRIGDILRATEGSTAPVSCLENGAEGCPHRDACTTIAFWQGLDDAIEAYVDSVMLSDLVRPDQPAARAHKKHCV